MAPDSDDLLAVVLKNFLNLLICSAQFDEYLAYSLILLETMEINVHLHDIQVDVCCTNLELYSFNEDVYKFYFIYEKLKLLKHQKIRK